MVNSQKRATSLWPLNFDPYSYCPSTCMWQWSGPIRVLELGMRGNGSNGKQIHTHTHAHTQDCSYLACENPILWMLRGWCCTLWLRFAWCVVYHLWLLWDRISLHLSMTTQPLSFPFSDSSLLRTLKALFTHSLMHIADKNVKSCLKSGVLIWLLGFSALF